MGALEADSPARATAGQSRGSWSSTAHYAPARTTEAPSARSRPSTAPTARPIVQQTVAALRRRTAHAPVRRRRRLPLLVVVRAAARAGAAPDWPSVVRCVVDADLARDDVVRLADTVDGHAPPVRLEPRQGRPRAAEPVSDRRPRERPSPPPRRPATHPPWAQHRRTSQCIAVRIGESSGADACQHLDVQARRSYGEIPLAGGGWPPATRPAPTVRPGS